MLLTEGVQELGKVVCTNIVQLIKELLALKFDPDKEEDPHPSTSADADGSEKVFKGRLTDR